MGRLGLCEVGVNLPLGWLAVDVVVLMAVSRVGVAVGCEEFSGLYDERVFIAQGG